MQENLELNTSFSSSNLKLSNGGSQMTSQKIELKVH